MLTPSLLFAGVLAAARLLSAQEHLSSQVWGGYRCGDKNSVLPSPTYHDEHPVFTVCSRKLIKAPLDKVYDTIINFGNYREWNTFVRRVDSVDGTSISPVGLYAEVIFQNYGLLPPLNTSVPTNQIVTVLQHDECDFAVTAWKYDDGLAGIGIRAEHTTVLTVTKKDGDTLYVSWDSYYGVRAVAIQPILDGNLQKQFNNEADDLKRYVEASGE